MNRERRKALGIPIHDEPDQHLFVDGFCSCGELDEDGRRRGLRTVPTRVESTGSLWADYDRPNASHWNLDRIEGNSEEYF